MFEGQEQDEEMDPDAVDNPYTQYRSKSMAIETPEGDRESLIEVQKYAKKMKKIR